MEGGVSPDCGRILEYAGWRQGSILTNSILQRIQQRMDQSTRTRLPSNDLCAVLVSQDCDLVRHQDVEWQIEIICGTWVEKTNPAYSHGRHERKLTLTCANGYSHLELDIRHRILLSKKELIDPQLYELIESPEMYQPDQVYLPDPDRTLTSDTLSLLTRWLGKRYSRPAFPDEFNRRVAKAAGKIKKLTKGASSRHVSAVYLMLNEPQRDLPPDEPYQAIFWFSCKRDIFESNGNELTDIQTFAQKYVEAIDACDGVQVLEGDVGWEVLGEHHITLDDLRSFKLYNYEHRSRAEKPGGDHVPEM